jgi:RNA polymerase sigma factor (sigma-70 family)
VALDSAALAVPEDRGEEVLDLDRALTKLDRLDPVRSRVVKLRYFAGLTIQDTAHALDISPATVNRHWTFARAWLCDEIRRARTTNGTAS